MWSETPLTAQQRERRPIADAYIPTPGWETDPNVSEYRKQEYRAYEEKQRQALQNKLQLSQLQQAQAAEAAVAAFYKGATSQSTEALLRFIANSPEITLSPKYPAVQEYIRMRQAQSRPAKPATVRTSPPATTIPATPAPATTGKELTPEQMMKLAEMKIASPAAYDEAVKMFIQAGYNVKPRTDQESAPPSSSQSHTVKFTELEYEELMSLAKGGNADAQFAMACRYYTGDEVKKDMKTAYNWLIESAHGGNDNAMFALGVHYQRGEGVDQDSVESYAWFYVANQKGHPDAAEKVEVSGASLTSAQKDQGVRRAAELIQNIKNHSTVPK